MKIELGDAELEIAEKIFDELVGLTIEEAKAVLKIVLAELDKCTVNRGDFDERH